MIQMSVLEWLHWLSSLTLDELLAIAGGLLVLDAPRYALTSVGICLWDWGQLVRGKAIGTFRPVQHRHCPSVAVVLVGHNEAETIGATLTSVWGTYPRLEILVVDDGSTDGMSDVARKFAAEHDGVRVFARPRRSGKASALNTALHYAQSEVIVPVDADSDLGENAIWEIVQPLADHRVGAVSGAILARNPFANLVTRLQAWEYLHAIFLGRMVTAQLGILGIVSGAFGAFSDRRAEAHSGLGRGPRGRQRPDTPTSQVGISNRLCTLCSMFHECASRLVPTLQAAAPLESRRDSSQVS